MVRNGYGFVQLRPCPLLFGLARQYDCFGGFSAPDAPTIMAITHSHKLVLPADANHHGTLYAGAMLQLMLEAGYATAWKHVGPAANLVLRRVLNMECLRPVPVGVVVEIQGAVLHRTAAYLICGLVGVPWNNEGPWAEALMGFAQVDETGKLTPFPEHLPEVVLPSGDPWERLERRMTKLLRAR